MTDLLYTRQQDIGLTPPQAVTIAGVGGIGFWVAKGVALAGVANIYLFDPDVFEEHNRNRLDICQSSVGRPKVDVVAEMIRAIRPDTIVVAVQAKLEGILLEVQLVVCPVIIDCTDSPKAQIALYNACKARGVNYIRSGYDVNHITLTSSISGWAKAGEEEAQYAEEPSWAAPPMILAGLTLYKLLRNNNQEVSLDISEIGIPVLQKQKRLTSRCVQDSLRSNRRRRR